MIKRGLKITLKGFFSKNKREFWFNVYKNCYLNNNICMAEILLDVELFNNGCPSIVKNDLLDWYNSYCIKKWPRLFKPSNIHLGLKEYNKLRDSIANKCMIG